MIVLSREQREDIQRAIKGGTLVEFIGAMLDEALEKGTDRERERIRAACREFNVGDTLVINAPTLLLESSVLRPRKK